MINNDQVIAVIGGTGALGMGLSVSLARVGLRVIVGSRSLEKAQGAADIVARESGSTAVFGAGIVEAAEQASLVIVAVPFANQVETLRTIREVVQGKIVVDTTVPLVPPKVAVVQLPKEGSAALIAAEALGDGVMLITAFHNVAAQKLRDGHSAGDILVFGNDIDARASVIALIDRIGFRGVHGGPLANSVAAEAMTSVLIAVNRRYKVSEGAGIHITGLEHTSTRS